MIFGKKGWRLYFCFCILFFFCAGLFIRRGIKVSLVQVKRQDVEESFREIAIVKGGEDQNLLSSVTGNVVELLVKEGDYVEAGEIVARIDPENYQDAIQLHNYAILAYKAQIAEAKSKEQNNKDDMEGVLKRLEVQAKDLETQIAKWQKEDARSAELFSTGDISQAEREEIQLRLENIKNQKKEVDIRISQEKKNKEKIYSQNTEKQVLAQIAVEEEHIRQLEKKIAKCEIHAPEAGYISGCYMEQGLAITEGQMLLTIKRKEGHRAELKVLSSYESSLKPGDAIRITRKFLGREEVFPGKINSIFNYGEKELSPLGLEEYKVKILVEWEEDYFCKPGTDVEVEFLRYSKKNVLTIPISSVFQVQNQDYVFVLRKGKAKELPVKLAYKGQKVYVLEEGGQKEGMSLKEGDKIIEDVNTPGLADGKHCRI